MALPIFHLIAREFPLAERRLLTDTPKGALVAPAFSIIGVNQLIHDVVSYPAETRSLRALLRVRKEIADWRPDSVIYIVEGRTWRQRLRDRAFLLACGVRSVIGWSPFRDISRNRPDAAGHRLESETSRLARAVRSLGDACIDEPANWSLGLTAEETAAGRCAMEPVQSCDGIVAFSVGTKWQPNDYGDERWRVVLATIAAAHPGAGLAAFGVAAEFDRTEALLTGWPGAKVNLCGQLNVRESAAALACATVFLGHDSGPMHLASAVGTPCVAVFSGRNAPGVWYPTGPHHRLFYNSVPCAPCGLTLCKREGKRCIYGIDPINVGKAGLELLQTCKSRLARTV